MSPMAWVLETEVFPDSHRGLRDAVIRAGHQAISWKDEWWDNDGWPRLSEQRVIFHGSLGNASRIARELPWSPGAYCDTDAFHCSAWYPRAADWLLHDSWLLLPARELVTGGDAVLQPLGNPSRLFVRPDSPLKPFSGRVVDSAGLTLEALDFGFYFDDSELPVIVAPVRSIEREWRFVIVGPNVVAGSSYEPEGRVSGGSAPEEAAAFARTVASRIERPQDVYIMDVCTSGGSMRLLELNPFSGADLHGCDRTAVVNAVSCWIEASSR